MKLKDLERVNELSKERDEMKEIIKFLREAKPTKIKLMGTATGSARTITDADLNINSVLIKAFKDQIKSTEGDIKALEVTIGE